MLDMSNGQLIENQLIITIATHLLSRIQLQPQINMTKSTLNTPELETLITQIVHRLLSQWHILPPKPDPNAFLATFGTWEDDRSANEIIQDIYNSRTVDSQ